MKKNYKTIFSTVLATTIAMLAIGQGVTMPALNSPMYQQMKLNGTLPKVVHQTLNTNVAKNAAAVSPGVISTSTPGTCDCLVPIDASFSDVPFTNGTAPYFSNDDGYTNLMALPFSFDYYGSVIDSIYINNNGNISFNGPYFTFTPDSFPSSNFNMIAPFWADVDTRGSGGSSYYDSLTGTWITPPGTAFNGRVRYKMTPTSLIIKWDSVGYFPSMGDKRNTFQLIITDGNDPLVPGGNNVAFCYGDMQWTTGAASQGVNGFGGTPSTTGINKGNAIDYFQVTRSNHDSTDYDGPYSNADGVSFLDNTSYYFTTNTGTAGNNIPPIALTNLCDTVFFDSGDDSTVVQFMFIGPENNQTVTATLSPNPDAFVLSSTSGIIATMTVQINSNLGRSNNNVEVTATDNLGATTTQKVVVVNGVTGINEVKNQVFAIAPNPTTGLLNIKLAKAGTVKVLNTLGSIIASENAGNSNLVSLDLTKEAKGIYFVQYNNGKEIITRKFVKE